MPDAGERGVLCGLLAGRRLELHDQFSGYPPAIFHLDALRLGPLPDLGSVQPTRRPLAPATGGPTGAAVDSPPSPHEDSQCVPQLLGMPAVQVDFIFRAVQPKADCAFGGAAVQVNEQGLYPLWAMAAPFLTMTGAPS